MGTVALHGGKRIVFGGLTDSVVDDTALVAEVSPPLLGQLLGHHLTALGTGADRHPDLDGQSAVVARREKLGTEITGGEQADAEDDDTDSDDDTTMAYAPVQTTLIPGVKTVKETLDGAIDNLLEAATLLLELQHLRAEHGREREGAGGGDGKDDAHHPAQLAEHHAGHSLNHRKRQEHGKHGERRGNNGDCHLVSGVNGRLLRVGSAFDVGGSILEHHNGIIDHQTDGDGETRERDDVERAVAQQQIDERSDERERNGDGPERTTPPESRTTWQRERSPRGC